MNSSATLIAAGEAEARAENRDRGKHTHHPYDAGWENGRLVQTTRHPAELIGDTLEAEASQDRRAAFMEALTHLLQWPIPNRRLRKGDKSSIAARFVALAWCLNPKIFDGRSLSEIARELELTPAALATHAGNLSREFSFRAPWQQQGSGKFRDELHRDDGAEHDEDERQDEHGP